MKNRKYTSKMAKQIQTVHLTLGPTSQVDTYINTLARMQCTRTCIHAFPARTQKIHYHIYLRKGNTFKKHTACGFQAYIHDVYMMRALYVYTGKERLKSYACSGVLLGGVAAVARMTLRLPRSEREFSANFWPGIWRPFFFSSSDHSAA